MVSALGFDPSYGSPILSPAANKWQRSQVWLKTTVCKTVWPERAWVQISPPAPHLELAQLGEHFVYTEGVGGPSPSF